MPLFRWILIFYIFALAQSVSATELKIGTSERPLLETPEIPCPEINQRFREYILGTVGQAKADYGRIASCLDETTTPDCEQTRAQILTSIRYQGELSHKLRSHILKDWTQTNPRRDLFSNCLNGQPKNSVFSGGSRELSFKNTNPICRSLSRSWSHSIDQLELTALKDGPTNSGLSPEEYEFFKTFRRSPLAHATGPSLISTPNLLEDALTQRLRQPLNQLRTSTETIADFTRNLKTAELYQLYLFENQFQQFAESLGAQKERAFQCKEASTFLKDCFALVGKVRELLTSTSPKYSWRERKNSCESRKYTGLLKILPFVSVYDAIKTNAVHTSAFASGVATRTELSQVQAEAAYQGLFGALFPLAPAAKLVQLKLAAPFARQIVSPGLIGATGNRYKVKRMRLLYAFEDFGLGWVRRFPTRKLRNLRVYVKDGKIVRQNGRPVNVENGIFVMDEYGNILLWNQDRSRAIKHSTLMGGRPIAGAGQTKIENGVITWINNDSGHYHPTREYLEQVVEELQKRGADFSSDFQIKIQ